MNLNGKIALITGASSGIGRATALLFAKHGATVVLQARGKDKLNEVEAAIESESGEAFVYTTDLTDSKACIAAGNSIISEVGIPDIIVNSAGAGYWISTHKTSAEEFHNMMDAPHYAAVHTIKVFLDHMIKRGNGHIVNINSAACYFSFPGAAGYLTSRWAMRGFTQALFQDLRGSGVTASMVVLGKVDSPYFTNNPGSEKRIPTIATAVMKTLSAEEAAEVILKSVVSKRKTIIAPWPMAISVAMSRYFPRAFGYLMNATGYKGIPNELEAIRTKGN